MPVRQTASAASAGSAPALLPAAAVSGRLPGLVAAFSTALPRLPDGELAPLLHALAQDHWGLPARALPPPLLLRQTHSARVLALEDAPQASAPVTESPPADGVRGVLGAFPAARLLAVKTADCVPLLAVDEELGAYAALHAGWRGCASGILPALLGTWRAGGSSLRGVTLELGPHIRACCYEVQADCLAHFDAPTLAGAVETRSGRSFLALAAALRNQALAAGVPAAQVHVSAHCSYCHTAADGAPPYASYRRATHQGRPFAGTNVGLIGVLPAR